MKLAEAKIGQAFLRIRILTILPYSLSYLKLLIDNLSLILFDAKS